MRALVTLNALLAAALLGGCAPGMMGTSTGTSWGPGSFDSNGERIYFTATSDRDTRISYVGGPDVGGMMMSGRLSCASCHGPNATGGRHTMQMAIMDAPDIRWRALSGETEGGQGHEGGSDDEHSDYDLSAFRVSVTEGQHADGEALNSDMPRWSMGEEDLSDLAAYLQGLD